MISYQQIGVLEFLGDPSVLELFAEHLELMKESGEEFDPDVDRYLILEATGNLQIIVAKKDEKIVGYCILVIGGNGHFKNSIVGNEDSYFVSKRLGFFRGRVMIDLILMSIEMAKKHGARKVLFKSIESVPTDRLLEFIGMHKVSSLYEMELGD